VFDLARHDHARHAFTLEKFDELAQVPYADPFDRAGEFFNRGIGLFLDRGDGHLDAFRARAFEH